MSIVIKPVGILKDYNAGQSELLVAAGPDVRTLLQSVNIPPELVALVLVNQSPQNKDFCPVDGDIIQLYAVIGGG